MSDENEEFKISKDIASSNFSNLGTNISREERLRKKAIRENNLVGCLGDYDCPVCKNKGMYIPFDKNGFPIMANNSDFAHVRCQCMRIRETKKIIRESGLEEQLNKCTFENYKTNTNWQKSVLESAKKWLESSSKCFYIGGHSGSGKTHICTAIVNELINKRMLKSTYMIWNSKIKELIRLQFDKSYQYEYEIDKLTSVPVLYIDDFLKPFGTDAKANTAAVSIAFDIINARYNKREKLLTIISSEYALENIREAIDEALFRRIYEMAKPFTLTLNGADKNCSVNAELTK